MKTLSAVLFLTTGLVGSATPGVAATITYDVSGDPNGFSPAGDVRPRTSAPEGEAPFFITPFAPGSTLTIEFDANGDGTRGDVTIVASQLRVRAAFPDFHEGLSITTDIVGELTGGIGTILDYGDHYPWDECRSRRQRGSSRASSSHSRCAAAHRLRSPAMKIAELFKVEGKVALVTGGTRGIGGMIARGFVENGVRTYVCSRKADACAKTAAELSRYGTCVGIAADLGTMEGVAQLVAELSARERALHILVNNAGANWGAPLDEFPEAGWDKVMDLNLKSIFFLTRDLLPQLRKAATADDPARVINIGSIDGMHVPFLDTYAYSAAKAGLHHMTRVLARRLASENMTVNAIAPGPFESQMMKATLEQFGDMIRKTNPRGRIGTPEDVAGTAIYLSSRASAYVTGTIVPVDGGSVTCL